jgi:hypothetical protein
MKTSKKPETFDAVAASRRWRARSSRELAGLTHEQLHARLSRFANAETLVKPALRRNAGQSRRAAASMT